MLTQSEADTLIAMQKKKANDEVTSFPLGGSLLTLPIVSLDGREAFLIDVNRGRIRLSKCSYQERYQSTIVLVRLDIDGPPHPNPDVDTVPLPFLQPYNGVTLPTPHLHLYTEGFMDKWAIPAPPDKFSSLSDLYETLVQFFTFCNIVEPPTVQKDLFT